mmetsp:Transcript_20300/g.48128  ORF Transcript_20300/g.48128 Transcript_20300/m.48128 type:complete len:297 (+) Transcript_20300:1187-2077(+)
MYRCTRNVLVHQNIHCLLLLMIEELQGIAPVTREVVQLEHLVQEPRALCERGKGGEQRSTAHQLRVQIQEPALRQEPRRHPHELLHARGRAVWAIDAWHQPVREVAVTEETLLVPGCALSLLRDLLDTCGIPSAELWRSRIRQRAAGEAHLRFAADIFAKKPPAEARMIVDVELYQTIRAISHKKRTSCVPASLKVPTIPLPFSFLILGGLDSQTAPGGSRRLYRFQRRCLHCCAHTSATFLQAVLLVHLAVDEWLATAAAHEAAHAESLALKAHGFAVNVKAAGIALMSKTAFAQ